ncbi:hypothetical protein [Halomonas urmiana]|uniref:hypothetical protein n=1 Tax=Halomonas urmiana TaxID=490901 RepID=UPI002697F7F3
METERVDLDAPIGVIADTHGTLRDEALALLEGSGLILHLGYPGITVITSSARRTAETRY